MGPGISILPSPPKVRLGPQRHLSCLKAAASKLARMPQAGITVLQPVQARVFVCDKGPSGGATG